MNSKENHTQNATREKDPKLVHSLYKKNAITTLLFGFYAIMIGLFIVFKFKLYPIYTIATITLSFIIVIFFDIILINKETREISLPIDEQ